MDGDDVNAKMQGRVLHDEHVTLLSTLPSACGPPGDTGDNDTQSACDFCESSTSRNKRCPCLEVWYCGKLCQVYPGFRV